MRRLLSSVLLLTLLGASSVLLAGNKSDQVVAGANSEKTPGAGMKTIALDTISGLVADDIEGKMRSLSASIKALGAEYASHHKTTLPMTEKELDRWSAKAKREQATTIFHPYATALPLKYQAASPSYLYYGKGTPTREAWRDLKTLASLTPAFKVSFNTFNDSWIYMTTVNDAFMIYPYLPLKKAVSNYPPRKQIFYTAADFKNKTFGWTPPYLDLVGAGMMVTVAYPVFNGEQLLGVISRDITLNQLSRQVLKPVAESGADLTTIVVDKRGLAIANSDAEAMAEINRVNLKAASAVLYYRAKSDLPSIPKAKNSRTALYNDICRRVLDTVKGSAKANKWSLDTTVSGSSVAVSVRRVPSTGWLVVTLHQQR